ncbi:hypothetical protein HG66A1_28970 [Gimesia chilikensis]|jgi:hypothetical protein|uniref:Uncharacterized protein n=2 Tax=Gimesia chilikensis TaxID=2605989 RepID=A0A517PP15_9PLAN|nr:hypothetical protein HG66A1_28970 [Gimesia chilikensis]
MVDIIMNTRDKCISKSRELEFQTHSLSKLLCTGLLMAVLCAPILGTDCLAEGIPTQGGSKLIVRDVGVYLVSAHGKKMNDSGMFRSTLPGFMQSRRLSADSEGSDKPTPLGLITFAGPEVKDIDVLVEFPSGRFLSHWPTARIQSRRIYWRACQLTKSGSASFQIPGSHWLSPLQQADRLFVNTNNKSDRFILYDVEVNHTPQISMTHSADGFQIQNREPGMLQHLTVIQPTANPKQWKLAAVDRVPGLSNQKSKPQSGTEDKTKASKVDPLSDKKLKAEAAAEEAAKLKVLGDQLRNVGALPQLLSGKAADSKKPATPAKTETKVDPVKIPYVEKQPVSREQILSFWGDYLSKRGLGKSEIEYVQRILNEYGFREDQATVIYCMDEGVLDKSIPLELTPHPDVLRRIALVILVDVDPALQKHIDLLIAQLGDPVWAKREEAQQELAEYGRAAQKQLQQATKNKDLEIVFRSEQLLEKIK